MWNIGHEKICLEIIIINFPKKNIKIIVGVKFIVNNFYDKYRKSV